jgi:hypothetical protein
MTAGNLDDHPPQLAQIVPHFLHIAADFGPYLYLRAQIFRGDPVFAKTPGLLPYLRGRIASKISRLAIDQEIFFLHTQRK